jgi:hypothetical protein
VLLLCEPQAPGAQPDPTVTQLPVLLGGGHVIITVLHMLLGLRVSLGQGGDPIGRAPCPKPGAGQLALGHHHQASITRFGQSGLGRGDAPALLGHRAPHVWEAPSQVAALHAELLEPAVVLVELGTQPAALQLELSLAGPRGLELERELLAVLTSRTVGAHGRRVLHQQRIEFVLGLDTGTLQALEILQRLVVPLLGIHLAQVTLLEAVLKLERVLPRGLRQLAQELGVEPGLVEGGLGLCAPR